MDSGQLPETAILSYLATRINAHGKWWAAPTLVKNTEMYAERQPISDTNKTVFPRFRFVNFGIIELWEEARGSQNESMLENI